MAGAIVVIGGTWASAKRSPAITPTSAGKWCCPDVMSLALDQSRRRLGGKTTGIALDLTRPKELAGALAGLGPVDHLVLAAIERDNNTIKDYDIDAAIDLVVSKLVGYAEAVHALSDRFTKDSSVVLFGGQARERPYPGPPP